MSTVVVSKFKLATCHVCEKTRMICHSPAAYAASRYHWRCSPRCEDAWNTAEKHCRLPACDCKCPNALVVDDAKLILADEARDLSPARLPVARTTSFARRAERPELAHRNTLLHRYREEEHRDWPPRVPGDRLGDIEAALQSLRDDIKELKQSLPAKIEEVAYEVAIDTIRDEVGEYESRLAKCEASIDTLNGDAHSSSE